MEIGNKIKEQRSKHKMTQQDLANDIMVSRATISSWEVGRTYPDLQTTVLLSNTFEVSLDYLLREEVEMMKDIDKKVIKSTRYKNILIGGSILIGIILLYSLVWGLITQPKRAVLNQSWQNKTSYYQKTQDDIQFTATKPTYPLFKPVSVEGENNKFRVFLDSTNEKEGISVTLLDNHLLSNLTNQKLADNEQMTIIFSKDWTDYNIGFNKQDKQLPKDITNEFVDKYKTDMKNIYYQTLQQWSDINL